MDVDGRRPVRKRQVDQLEKAGRRRPAEKDRLKKAGRRRPVEKGSGRCQPGKKSRMVDIDQEKVCGVDVDRQWLTYTECFR